MSSCFARPNRNLRLAALGDENIRGLDVAMEDALRVRRIERVGHSDGQINEHVHAQRTAGDAILQRHALEHSMAMNGVPSSSSMS